MAGSWGSALTSLGPALATFDGGLYAAWKDKSSGRIGYSASHGSAWAPQVVLAEITPYAPAITGDPASGSLIVAWTTSASKIKYIFCCGTSAFTVPQALTNASPAVTFISGYPDGTIYVAWKGTTTGSAGPVGYEASINGMGFTPQEFVPQALTQRPPGAGGQCVHAVHGMEGQRSQSAGLFLRRQHALLTDSPRPVPPVRPGG